MSKLKQAFNIFYPIFSLLIVAGCIELIINSSVHGDSKYVNVMLISVLLPQIIYIYFLINLARSIYQKKIILIKKVYFFFYISFFTFLFLHFFFYILFYVVFNYDSIGEHYFFFSIFPVNSYMIFGFTSLIIIIIKLKLLLLRYFFVFLAAMSDMLIKYIININFIDIFQNSNKLYYEQNLYLIPILFALIQLLLEIYYIYSKSNKKISKGKSC